MRRVAAVLAISLLCLTACGGALREAQAVTNVAGWTIHETDKAVAQRVTAATQAAVDDIIATCLRAGGVCPWEPNEELARRMYPWRVLRRALETARETWLAMARALDAWEAGEAGGEYAWFRAASCASSAFTTVVDMLRVRGVEIPEKLVIVTETLRGFARGVCEGSEGSSQTGSAGLP